MQTKALKKGPEEVVFVLIGRPGTENGFWGAKCGLYIRPGTRPSLAPSTDCAPSHREPLPSALQKRGSVAWSGRLGTVSHARRKETSASIPSAIIHVPALIARPDRFVGRQASVDCGEAVWPKTPLHHAKGHSMPNVSSTSARQRVRAQP